MKITAPYQTDLGLVIYWLKLNDAISSASKIKKSGSEYSVSVKSKKGKDTKALVKDRFGVFAKVS